MLRELLIAYIMNNQLVMNIPNIKYSIIDVLENRLSK